MKKSLFFTLLFLITFATNTVFADSWDDFANVDRMWDGQKSITNKEFEEVMDALQEKSKAKEDKQKRKKMKKISGGGTSLHNGLNPDKDVPEMAKLKDKKEEGLLLNIPVDLLINEKILEKGYYKVIATKEDGLLYLNFYQSQYFKGKVEATETQDDFGEDVLDFVKIISYSDSFVKIIFGSLDFNAYVYVPFRD